MASITFNHLTSGAASGSSGSTTTASITPTGGRFHTAFVRGRTVSGTVNRPTITGCGLTWTYQIEIRPSGSLVNGLWLFRGTGTPTAGALTIDFAGQNISTIGWTIDEWSNVNLGGTNGSNGIVQTTTLDQSASTSASMTLSALADSNNVAIGFLDQYNQITTLTLGSGFSEIKNNGFDGDDSWLAEYKLNTTTVDASSNSSQAWIGIAAELKFLPPSGGFFEFFDG